MPKTVMTKDRHKGKGRVVLTHDLTTAVRITSGFIVLMDQVIDGHYFRAAMVERVA